MKQEKHNTTNDKKPDQDAPQMQADQPTAPEDEKISDVQPDDSEESEEEDPLKKYEQTRAELDQKKKDYLLLMADFDNYRKRVLKEKAELIKNASERVLKGLLPIVDDFERGLEATKDDNDAAEIRQGFELIYTKLVKYLSDCGVTPIQSTGADFNDELHEAIATIPAPTAELKGKVIDTTTKGYTLNDKVLRHAKVVVGE